MDAAAIATGVARALALNTQLGCRLLRPESYVQFLYCFTMTSQCDAPRPSHRALVIHLEQDVSSPI